VTRKDWWECDDRDFARAVQAHTRQPVDVPAGTPIQRITDEDVTTRAERMIAERDAQPKGRRAWVRGGSE
jgi:hypothetical protein